MSQPLVFIVSIKDTFEVVVERVSAALKQEGFGVLTHIDVKATLKEKIGVDFRPYVILGACNPPLAHRALANEPGIGVMLPCNITVEANQDDIRVSIANPEAMLTMGTLSDNPVLQEVASEARARLERVAQALQQ